MGDIRIIVDLPSEGMLSTLKLQPLDFKYDSARLKDILEKRLPGEFPGARMIKVNIVPTSAFFGADVMGIRIDEVLATMKKLSDTIASAIKEEASPLNIKD